MLREHSLDFRVRYQETDAQGRVHHANFLTYFEMGRTELFRAQGYSYRAFEESGLLLVVHEVSVRYLGAAKFDDLLCLRTVLESAAGVRVSHSYHLSRDGVPLAEGRIGLVCVDPMSGKPRRLPRDLLAMVYS